MSETRESAQAQFRGWHSRGYLPHFDQPDLVQAVTFRLADSLPHTTLKSLALELPREQSAARRERIEELLDSGHGACLLRESNLAQQVQDSLLFFDGQRYRLLAWVVMPNHVHAVLETSLGFSLSSIMHSVKRHSARQINLLLGRAGALWQPEYFDRLMRDEAHLARTIEYIHNNPVKAKLYAKPEDWPWSSARSAAL